MVVVVMVAVSKPRWGLSGRSLSRLVAKSPSHSSSLPCCAAVMFVPEGGQTDENGVVGCAWLPLREGGTVPTVSGSGGPARLS